MKHLKKFNIFFEELNYNVLPTDSADVKKAKEELNQVQKDTKEYNQKKTTLDKIFNDLESTNAEIDKEVNTKVFQNVKGRRNKYLVHYMTICQYDRMKKKLLQSIANKKIDKSDYQELLSQTDDSETKKRLSDEIKDKSSEMTNNMKKISEIEREMASDRQELNNELKKDVEKIKKNLIEVDKDRRDILKQNT